MNRRELLAQIGNVATAAAGVALSVDAIDDSDLPPLLFVIKADHYIDGATIDAIRSAVKPIMKTLEKRTGVEIPVIILHNGIVIDLIRQPK